MNENILVSVIVPIYNVEKYLDECVQSILNQTHKNLEVILVDDGSPDGCPVMCDNYQRQDSRVRVIHKKNEGLGFARNRGLDIASGEYVMFTDSDDYLDHDAVESFVEEIVKNNAQLVRAGLRKIDDSGKVLYKRESEKRIFKGEEVDLYLSPRLLGSTPSKSDSLEMSVCTSLYLRRIIEENNLRFDSEREVVSEDLPFNLSFLSHCETAVLTDKITYNYRYNPDSLSETYQPEKFLKIVDFFNLMERRFPDLIDREKTRFSRLLFLHTKNYTKKELLNRDASRKMIIDNIYKICNNPTVVKRIKDYPISELPLKHQIFIRLVKNKRADILYYLAKYNVY